jgi:UDP-hydrolysing UDP-N-acetyl-D-glucosamine 2-epimerase
MGTDKKRFGRMKEKKILVPIFNRAHLGRLRPVMKAIQDNPKLELQVITAVPAAFGNFRFNIKHSRPRSWRLALPWYVRARILSLSFRSVVKSDHLSRAVINDGFPVNAYVPLFLDGGISETMAKSVGFGLISLVEEFKRLKPDVVFINADRFEMMAVAIAAAYLNIPIAHNEGGNLSGTIDESVRHAITKLSHIHFVDTSESRARVIQMGEDPERVFEVGSPAIDAASQSIDTKPVLGKIDFTKPYILALHHPVATESDDDNARSLREVIKAIDNIRMPTVFLGSNADAGSHPVGEVMRQWHKTNPQYVFFTKYLPPDDFYSVLKHAACAVGNSSSFIREGAYYGTPAVLVGTRQSGRERGENVLEVEPKADMIEKAVLGQIQHERYKQDLRFGAGRSGELIAQYLADIEPNIQKKFYEAKK